MGSRRLGSTGRWSKERGAGDSRAIRGGRGREDRPPAFRAQSGASRRVGKKRVRVVGLTGFGEQEWPSLNRTHAFYRRAFETDFDLEQIDGEWPADEPDVLLNFSGNRGWDRPRDRDYPTLFGMHGGPILDHDFLWAQLGRLETSDVLLVNCASDERILRRFFEGNMPEIWCLPLPVDPTLFRPLQRDTCRRRLRCTADFAIGFVGRLVPQRNLHRFLQLLTWLQAQMRPQTVSGLVIGTFWTEYPVLNFGASGYPDYIAALIDQLELDDEHVRYFHGDLSDEDLVACYGAMDVLIHPANSIDENFGYVPVEAMACGTPVVGAVYGGLKDTVLNGETGFLMPTWTTRSGIRMDLTSGSFAVRGLLTDSSLRSRMSAAAIRHTRDQYSFDAFARQLRGAVEKAIASKPAAEPVTLAARPDRPPTHGLLPAANRPWRLYEQAVSDYVSGPPPVARPESSRSWRG